MAAICLVVLLWPKDGLEIVEWYSSDALANRSLSPSERQNDLVFVVVKSRVKGRIPWAKPGEPWSLDRHQFGLVTSEGEEITPEFIGETRQEGLGGLFTLVEGHSDVTLPQVVFLVRRQDVNKGGLKFDHIAFPSLSLSEGNRHEQHIQSKKGDQPYIGAPPPVEFEIKGFRLASSVPVGGRLQIRNSKIIPPPAPDGFEFCRSDTSWFAWKPISGKLLLVSCKLTVKEPTPQLETITLLHGGDEVATLSGVAQPGFNEGAARDLNKGLAQCHKSSKTPELELVFRIPDEYVATAKSFLVELRWTGHTGTTLSGKYSLRNVPEVPNKPTVQPSPPEDEDGQQ